VIMCAKNYKSEFTFVEVIQKKCRLFSGHGVEENFWS